MLKKLLAQKNATLERYDKRLRAARAEREAERARLEAEVARLQGLLEDTGIAGATEDIRDAAEQVCTTLSDANLQFTRSCVSFVPHKLCDLVRCFSFERTNRFAGRVDLIAVRRKLLKSWSVPFAHALRRLKTF